MEEQNTNATPENEQVTATNPDVTPSEPAHESQAQQMVQNFISNGVTKEELKAVLQELFPEKQDTTEEVLNKYILSLKGGV